MREPESELWGPASDSSATSGTSATEVSTGNARTALEGDGEDSAVEAAAQPSTESRSGGPAQVVRRRPTRLGVGGVLGAKRVPTGRETHHSRARRVTEWLVIVVAALTIALTVRATMVQAFYIPSESMVPTLKVGDRLLVDKIGYRMHDVHRGDIVVFRRPPAETNKTINDLIKRVIGLPGETVEAIDGKVYVNSQMLAEKYLPEGTVTVNMPRQVIPVDNYWVMGDNRGNSADSRVFGPINRKLIVGRAFLRVFPVTKVGRL